MTRAILYLIMALMFLLAAPLVAAVDTPTLLEPADGYTNLNDLTVQFTCSENPGNTSHPKFYTFDGTVNATLETFANSVNYTFSEYFIGIWNCYVCGVPVQSTYDAGTYPFGISVDSEGNGWTVDYSTHQIVMLNASDFYSEEEFPLGSSGPEYTAVDSQDNIWTATHTGDDIVFLNKSEGYSVNIINITTNAPRPIGLAIDPADNVWVALQQNGSVVMYNRTSELLTFHSFSYGGGTERPYAVCIDKNTSDVFVTDYSQDRVYFLDKSSTPPYNITSFSGEFNNPQSCAVTDNGDLWVGNVDANTVTRLDKSDGWSTTNYTTHSGVLGVAAAENELWASLNGGALGFNNVTNVVTGEKFQSEGTNLKGVAFHDNRVWVVNTGTDNVTIFNLAGASGCSNATANRSINIINFSQCSDGDATQALNYTIKDEQNDTVINGSITPNFVFIGGAAYQPGILTPELNYAFCLAPPAGVATISTGEVLYTAVDTVEYDYPRNYYYFTGDEFTGDVVSDTSLFLLDNIGTATLIEIVVDGEELSTGLLVVERYIEATGEYKQVGMTTITNGEANIDLEYTTATYKFLIYDGLGENADLLCVQSSLTISGTYQLFCLSTGHTTTWWGNFVELRDAEYTFAFNNVTNISALTWAIPTGVAAQNCYRVTKWEGASTTQEFYNCTSATSGTYTYTITDMDANYNLQYVVQIENGTCCQVVSGHWLSLKESLFDKVGDDTVLYTILIVLMLGLAGLSISPAATVGMAGVGLFISWLFGFLNIGIAALAAILLVGGVLMAKMK